MTKLNLIQVSMIVGTVTFITMLPTLADTLSQVPDSRFDTSPTAQPQLRGSSSFSDQSNLMSKETPLATITDGNLNYVTGGIGEEERDQLKAEESKFNVQIINLSSGAYVGTTNIIIRDVKGTNLLDVSSGPIFLANLPGGHYKIIATSQDQTQMHSLNVVPGKATSLDLNWN